MNINIFGSTGIIGQKTLSIIKNYFPKIKINLLCANSSLELLSKQVKLYKPNYVYINNQSLILRLKQKINNKTKILTYKELLKFLKETNSDYTILAISGYKSLYFLDQIILNTKNLGIVNKESIVSAGHIFKKKNYFKKTKIFPLDSEHFSLFNYFSSGNSNKSIRKITLTASGGPFFKSKYKNLEKISFQKAIQHPKWKMGYKNSIDSATLVNKCLEVIEAHYLFDIPYNKIDVLIHPQAIIHSIIEFNNYVSIMNSFKNDMQIPIINFLSQSKKTKEVNKNLFYNFYNQFNFLKVDNSVFPIYKYFLNLDKSNPANLIKFNIGNEYAVNLFKKNLIKYTDIYKIIKKVGYLNLYYPLNTIKDIIIYHERIEKKLKDLSKNIF